MQFRRACLASIVLLGCSAEQVLSATKPVTTSPAKTEPSLDASYVTTFVPPKKGMKGTVTLPEPARILPEKSCSKEDLAMLAQIVPQRVSCFGSMTAGQSRYLFVQNWLATEAEPGVIQVVSDGVPLGSIAGSTGGWVSMIEKRSGGVEIISISPKSAVPGGSLPYLRYGLKNNRIALISASMFAAGSSPIDENRRRFTATASQSAAPAAAPTAPPAATGGRSAPGVASRAPTNGASPHCSFARWSGDIPNITDLFLCDEARAIDTFSRGARFVLKPDAVRFADGKYLVRMTQRPSATSASINRMQNKFNWNDWVYSTQNITSTEVFCAFNSNPVAKGQTAVVSGKLDTYANNRIILVCTRN